MRKDHWTVYEQLWVKSCVSLDDVQSSFIYIVENPNDSAASLSGWVLAGPASQLPAEVMALPTFQQDQAC